MRVSKVSRPCSGKLQVPLKALFSTLNISSWESCLPLTYFTDNGIKAHGLSHLPRASAGQGQHTLPPECSCSTTAIPEVCLSTCLSVSLVTHPSTGMMFSTHLSCDCHMVGGLYKPGQDPRIHEALTRGDRPVRRHSQHRVMELLWEWHQVR